MKKLTKKLSILNAYIDFSISKVSNFRVTSGVVPNSSKELLQDNLDDEEYSLINKNNSENEGITFKFKLIEFFQNLKFSSK